MPSLILFPHFLRCAFPTPCWCAVIRSSFVQFSEQEEWDEEHRIHFLQMLMIFLSPLQNKAFDPNRPPDFMVPLGNCAFELDLSMQSQFNYIYYDSALRTDHWA